MTYRPGLCWTWWRFAGMNSIRVAEQCDSLDVPDNGEYALEVRSRATLHSAWSNRLNMLKGQRILIAAMGNWQESGECAQSPRIVGVLGDACPPPEPPPRDHAERINELLRSNNELRERAMAAETARERADEFMQTFAKMLASVDKERARAVGRLLRIRVDIRMLIQPLEAEIRAGASAGHSPVDIRHMEWQLKHLKRLLEDGEGSGS